MTRNYILTAIGIYLQILISSFSIYIYYKLELYEEYLLPIAIILLILIILCLLFYFSRHITLYNFGTFIMLLTNVILIYNIISINNQNGYITNILTQKYTYSTYNLYVPRKNTIYSNIYKLENKKIGILKNNEYNIESYLNKTIASEIIVYDDLDSLSNALENSEIQGILIKKDEYNQTEFTAKGKIRLIYHGKIKENI